MTYCIYYDTYRAHILDSFLSPSPPPACVPNLSVITGVGLKLL